jgi:hypothetical protein
MLIGIHAIVYPSLPEGDLIKLSKQVGEKVQGFTITIYTYVVGVYDGSLNLFSRSRDDLTETHNHPISVYFNICLTVTARSGVLEKLTVPQVVRNKSPNFTQPEGSSP